MNSLRFIVSAMVAAVLFASGIDGAVTTCDDCAAMLLNATGGLEEEWSRYFEGHWEYKGQWQGSAWFMCTECSGLEDKLIFYEDAWMVVDCFPDAEDGCYNGHYVFLESQWVGDDDGVVCPYFDHQQLNPWKYCDGNLGAQGVCDHYSEDDTVMWICTELN